jgi:hypothetical protein
MTPRVEPFDVDVFAKALGYDIALHHRWHDTRGGPRPAYFAVNAEGLTLAVWEADLVIDTWDREAPAEAPVEARVRRSTFPWPRDVAEAFGYAVEAGAWDDTLRGRMDFFAQYGAELAAREGGHSATPPGDSRRPRGRGGATPAGGGGGSRAGGRPAPAGSASMGSGPPAAWLPWSRADGSTGDRRTLTC